LDFRKFGGAEAGALEHLKHFPFEPSFLIRSGGGFHPYWKFSSPQRPNNDVLVLLRRVTDLVGGDPAVAHFAAILRIPGTLNSKYAVVGPPGFVKVKIDPRSTGRRYSFGDLFGAVKDCPVCKGYSLNVGVEDYPPPPSPLSEIPEKFYALLRGNEKVRRTWEGRRPDLRDQSRSGYDMSMTAQLVHQGYSDEEILTVLMDMPSGKGGAGRIDYFMHGLRKVRQEMNEGENEPNGEEGATADPNHRKRLYLSFKEYLELGGDPIVYLIQGLMPKGSFTLVSGPPKVGKSFLTILMAICLATGREFLGQKVAAPRKVLFVEEEDMPQMVVKRINQVCGGLNLTQDEMANLDKNLFFWSRNGLLIHVGGGGYRTLELETDIQEVDADVLIIDVFALIHDGEENFAKDMTPVLKKLVQYQDTKEGLTLILLHHTNKQTKSGKDMHSIRGSSVISGRTDNALFITPQKGGLILHQVTKWGPPLPPIAYNMVDDDEDDIVRFKRSDDFVLSVEKRKLQDLVSKLREVAPEKFTSDDIKDALGTLNRANSGPTVTRIKDKLVEAGLIELIDKGEKGKQFFKLV